MPKPQPTKPHYLVINADEGEPGTFKDRTHHGAEPALACVEGCIIGCYGIGAHVAYIYVRDELHLSKERLWGAIEEARAKGYLGKTPVRQRLPGRGLRPHRRRRVHLRRGDGAPQLARGQARRAAAQAAVPGAGRRVRLPDARSTTSRRSPSCPPRSTMGGDDVLASSRDLHHLNDGGARLFGVSGHVKKPGVVRGVRRPHAARAHLRPRRRRPRATRAPRRDPRRLVVPGPARRRDRQRARTRSRRSTRGTARASSTCRSASTRSATSARMLGTCCAIVHRRRGPTRCWRCTT